METASPHRGTPPPHHGLLAFYWDYWDYCDFWDYCDYCDYCDFWDYSAFWDYCDFWDFKSRPASANGGRLLDFHAHSHRP